MTWKKYSTLISTLDHYILLEEIFFEGINYKSAVLKIYDFPIFYFPKFFHPDPTVKRQSGFLSPFFSTSTTVGTGTAVPYYWAISDDKDLTFTPKIYAKGQLTLDTSFTQGYKNTSTTKTAGSRNHIFANLDFDLSQDESYSSDLLVKIQKTSNDTYFRIHDINTALVNSENTTLENEIKYSFSKSDMYININASVFENLRVKKESDRYEYILQNVMYGKTFFS